MELGSIRNAVALPRAGRVHPGTWALLGGVALSLVAGVLAGGGDPVAAVVAVGVPAFVLAAAAAPARTALVLLVALPFFFYPASVGGFSLFLAAPLFGFVSLVLLTRARRILATLRGDLPLIAFAILAAFAIGTAALSDDPARAFSRVAYLVLFGLFAAALATAVIARRIERTDLVRAIALSGAVAAGGVLFQFLYQFAVGESGVLEWLSGIEAAFAGERAASTSISNLIVADIEVVRGVFPFMAAPSAGQFLMLTLIAAVWLRREARGRDGGRTLETALVLLIGLGLLATFSRQAWVGAAVGILVLGLGRRSLGILLAAIPAFLLLSLVPIPGGDGTFGSYLLSAGDTASGSSGGRLELWRQAVDLLPQYGLVGVGPGLIVTLNTDPLNPIYYAHNAFLDAAVELGVGGALALIAVVVGGIAASMRRRAALPLALIFAWAVANLFDDALYFPRNGLLLAAAFALIPGFSPREDPDEAKA